MKDFESPIDFPVEWASRTEGVIVADRIDSSAIIRCHGRNFHRALSSLIEWVHMADVVIEKADRESGEIHMAVEDAKRDN